MGQTPDEIRQEINHTRANLTSNLQQLEHRVKSVADWRHHYRAHTAMGLLLAFSGGVLLSGLLGRSGAARLFSKAALLTAARLRS